MGQVTLFSNRCRFEDLTESVVEAVYGGQIGRPDQAQSGVGVHAARGRAGAIGVQCKRLHDLDAKNEPLSGGQIDGSCCGRKPKGALVPSVASDNR